MFSDQQISDRILYTVANRIYEPSYISLEMALSIYGIIPTAGSSRRLGQDKRRLSYRGSTVLETTINCLRQGGLSQLCVVLETNSPCRDLLGLQGTLIVENPQPERGMLSSIQIALATISQAAHAVAVLPGDHPFLLSSVVSCLAEYFQSHQPALLLPCFAGQRGHPLFIHQRMFPAVMECTEDQGLRQILSRFPNKVQTLDFEIEGADDDIDFPEDLVKLSK